MKNIAISLVVIGMAGLIGLALFLGVSLTFDLPIATSMVLGLGIIFLMFVIVAALIAQVVD